MRSTSYSEFRKNLAANLDRVNNDCEPVIITRDRGKPPAVLMSLEEFASYEETNYLLRSPVNARYLRESIAEMEASGGTDRKLIE
jgi:antitoxin YefM